MFKAAGRADDEAPIITNLSFRAAVQEQVIIFSYSGPVVVTGFDPHYVVKLKMEFVCAEAPEFAAFEMRAFAIHSPTHVFAGENAVGKTYDFTLTREIHNGKTRYRNLRIKPPRN
jgi:hypothetical protein